MELDFVLQPLGGMFKGKKTLISPCLSTHTILIKFQVCRCCTGARDKRWIPLHGLPTSAEHEHMRCA